MSYIIVSIPHSGTRALTAALGASISDFRGQFEREGHAYTFNPGHPPFWGHPEPPYIEWIVRAPYPLLTPVRPLADIARSWIARAPAEETQDATIERLDEYLMALRVLALRRPLVPVDMRLIPRTTDPRAPAPLLSSYSMDRLRAHSLHLLYPGQHWPVGEARAYHTATA